MAKPKKKGKRKSSKLSRRGGVDKKTKTTERQDKIAKTKALHPRESSNKIGARLGTTGKSVRRELSKTNVQNRLAHHQETVRAMMESRERLNMDALLDKLEEGLDSTETKVFQGQESKSTGAGKNKKTISKPKIVYSQPLADMGTRRGYLHDALEINGALRKRAEAEAPPPDSRSIIFNISNSNLAALFSGKVNPSQVFGDGKSE